MHGEIISDWKLTGDKLSWSVRIPANTTARVFVPSEPGTAATESGVGIEKAAGIRVIGREGKFLVCEAVSGNYTFGSTLSLNR
jgi:alpha-L-rhamnosidase